MITVYTNVRTCACGTRAHGFFAIWNHILNSGCKVYIKCRCGDVVIPNQKHQEGCYHFRKPLCGDCGRTFKNEDKYMNHVDNSKCTFQMEAQSFGNAIELRQRCRDNTYRRRLVKNLILHTEFWQENSLLKQLDLPMWPAFTNTSPPKLFRTIEVDGKRCVIHLKDREASVLWQRLNSAKFEAQIGFDINHKVSISDPNMIRMMDSLSSMIDNLKVEASIAGKVICVACKLLILCKMDFSDWALLAAWIYDLIYSLGLPTNLIRILIGRVQQHFDQMEAQGPGIPIAWIGSLIDIFSVIFFEKIPSMTALLSIVKLGNLARGITNIWQLADRVISDAFPRLYQHFTGFPYHIDELRTQFARIREWYTEIQQLLDVDLDTKIAVDKDVCLKVQNLYREGLQYASMAQELKLDSKSVSALNAHFGVVRMMYDKVQMSGAFNGGPRLEPLVIHLYGASGVGKSGMMYPLAIDLLKIEGIPNGKWAQEIYARAVEQEFWDGYKQQRIVLYDDFGQKVDSITSPNEEFFEIIRTGNLAPYPLHMASLLEKSKTFFTSKVVLLSSNIDCFRPVSLTAPEAVRRRIDISVQVVVRPEFRDGNGRMDPQKVLKATGKAISTVPYAFYMLDPNTGHHAERDPLSYEQFRKKCIEKYEQKHMRTERVLREYNEMAAQSEISDFNQEILDWSDAEIREFILTIDAHSDIISDSSIENIKTVDFSGAGFGRVWGEWRDWLHENLELSPQAFDILKTEKREQENIAKRMQMSLSQLVGVRARFYPKEEVNTEIPWYQKKWANLKEKCVEQCGALESSLSSFLEKAGAFIKEHPFITTLLVALPFVLAFFAASQSEPDYSVLSEKYLKQRGTVHEDGRICEEPCNEKHYSFDQWMESQKKGIQSEIAASGDPKTVAKPRFRVELASSGDPKTKNPKQNHVEISASGDPKTQQSSKMRVEGRDFEAELRRDENAFQLSRKIVANMYSITCYDGMKVLGTLRGFFVTGRVFMTVRHLMPLMAMSTHVRIWNNSKPDGFLLPVEQLRTEPVKNAVGELKDQVLIECPRLVHDHANILESFIDSEGMSATTRYRGLLLTPDQNGVIMRYGNTEARDTPTAYTMRASDDIPEMKFHIRQRYLYDLETSKGDCGSPLIAISSSFPKKLIGMHVAGNVGLGMSTPFNRKEIDEALLKLSEDAQVELDADEFVAHMLYPDEVGNLPEGNFTPLGVGKFRVNGSSKTALKPSLIHNMVKENITIPASLGPIVVGGDVVDPMMKGLTKGGKLSEPLDMDLLDACVKDFSRNFTTDMTRQRVLTQWEAVVGIEGDEFAPPIKRSTSPGYPFRQQNKKPGKTHWLGKEEYKLDSEMKKLMDERVSLAINNKRMPTIWTDTLKDERRPIEKVNAGKTRVFAGGPIDFTLVFRQYFLGFAAHVSHNRNLNEISVGTNVYSQDWTVIAEMMKSKGTKVIAGDFSNFDGTLHVEILHRLVEIINDWYNDTEEDKQVRKILWREILNSIHICRDTVYMWTHSQPSGCPLTAVLNSMYNAIACRYVWMLITKGTIHHSMREFRKHVCMVSYGDDNLLNVSDEAIEFFNQLTMAEAFSTFGMTYTDETKSGNMLPFKTLEEVQYLKRKFVYDDARMLYDAPLDLNTVLEIPNWIRKSPNDEEATQSNVEGAAFELSLHGQEIFDEWTMKLEQACRAKNLFPQILTFYEYRMGELEKYGQITAKTEMDCEILDHNHEGLPRGVRTTHKHVCEVCGAIYEHTHVIKTYAQSLPFGQKCRECSVTVR